MVKTVRALGWTLIAVGAVVLLYLVYLLFFTNLSTDRAQASLSSDFGLQFGQLDQALPGEEPLPADTTQADPVDPGDAYAALWFTRGGSDERIVHADPLYVVEGVSPNALQRGPGHYSDTAGPGATGNFAISGHRTTYGAPFYNLDELAPGDRVHVVDRALKEWVYEVVEQRVVRPNEVWVIGADPLETGRPTMTMTTCHPRFSAAQRLIVFAELVTT